MIYVGDRVQGIYKFLPYIGRVVYIDKQTNVATIELEHSLLTDRTALSEVKEHCKNLEEVC